MNKTIEPQVQVEAGIVRGVPRDEHGVLAFKGIPHAAPPIGDLRWRAPQPPQAWVGVRDATQFGARCWSAWQDDPTPWPPQSEDCLSLNIWTAAQHADERRPVMVWIHGGGFEFGTSADPSTDGARLAQRGVVLVSCNYRVGVLGFLAHPELDREGPSGNYGLQDPLAALRWVQANIARFGEDPDNITVFGESAGAHALGILMASPLAKGLLHKAIGESGAFWDSMHGSLPIPLLAGWNDVEQWPFQPPALPHQTAQGFRQAAGRLFGQNRLAELLTLYPAESDVQAAESAEALIGDLTISEQTWEWLELQQRSGEVPVYGYTFTYTSPYVPIASHLVEVPFVFGTLTPQHLVGSEAPPAEADRVLSETIMSYWVNFASRGDPNGSSLPHWPAYDSRGVVQNLGKTVGPHRNGRAAHFRFLMSYRTDGAFPDSWRNKSREEPRIL
jgi:carboxylesterase type B